MMIPYNYTEFIDGLTFLVKNNFVPMSRIDDAVKRILRVKFTMGIFEHPLADYSMTKYVGLQVSGCRFTKSRLNRKDEREVERSFDPRFKHFFNVNRSTETWQEKQ